jgi:hypothetical protein
MRRGAPAQSDAWPQRAAWQVLGVVLILLLSPIILGLLLVYFVYAAALHAAIWAWWLPRGRDVLFVYSDSPVWQAHVEREILPHIERRAVVLNWSRRARWPVTLATIAFHHFGGDRSFNPMAVVFRPARRARVFRFWQAFRDAKHGNTRPLRRMEDEFLALLGVDRPAHPAA